MKTIREQKEALTPINNKNILIDSCNPLHSLLRRALGGGFLVVLTGLAHSTTVDISNSRPNFLGETGTTIRGAQVWLATFQDKDNSLIGTHDLANKVGITGAPLKRQSIVINPPGNEYNSPNLDGLTPRKVVGYNFELGVAVTDNGNANNNSIVIDRSTDLGVINKLLAGGTNNGNSLKNTITINGNVRAGTLIAGFSKDGGSAKRNSINIKGNVELVEAVAAVSGLQEASNNQISLDGSGTIKNIIGARFYDGAALSNTVSVSMIGQADALYSGLTDKGNASHNNVFIRKTLQHPRVMLPIRV